jgi:light-regulated signal transduction histidine kinase (bacteriophytochrome)
MKDSKAGKTPPDNLRGRELEQQHRDLVRRTERLALAMGELEQLALTVAQDFHAPLSGIANITSALLADSTSLTPELSGGLRAIARHRAVMDAMLAHLLDLWHAATRPLELATIDMEALVHESWAKVDQKAGAQLVVGKLPAARADRGMLRLVWDHLLSNAVRYSSLRTPPRIEVTGGEGGEQAVYGVRDNGTGFELDGFSGKLVYACERIQKDYPGTSVGLAIVQRIITRHRGNIWVESRPDHGSLFEFSLPLRDTD